MSEEEVYKIFRDGDQWCAVAPGFVDIAISPCGFGETPKIALDALLKAIAQCP
jgi:hypothetical protein